MVIQSCFVYALRFASFSGGWAWVYSVWWLKCGGNVDVLSLFATLKNTFGEGFNGREETGLRNWVLSETGSWGIKLNKYIMIVKTIETRMWAFSEGSLVEIKLKGSLFSMYFPFGYLRENSILNSDLKYDMYCVYKRTQDFEEVSVSTIMVCRRINWKHDVWSMYSTYR